MITTTEHILTTNKTAYDRLQTADKASLLLLSDTHGAIDAVKWIFSEMGHTIEACLFAGDGANDIVRAAHILDKEAENKKIPAVIIVARGNCDAECCNIIQSEHKKEYTFSIPLYQKITVAQQNILLTHGHLYNIDFDRQLLHRTAYEAGCTFAIHGHTHMQDIHYETRTVIINPGSPTRPRGKSPAGFAVLELDRVQKKRDHYPLHIATKCTRTFFCSYKHTAYVKAGFRTVIFTKS